MTEIGLPVALEWPNGADVAVSLTFDVDADSALDIGSNFGEPSISSLSERQYGVMRGLERLLTMLADLEIRATFYVPGDTVDRYSTAIREIEDSGHELAHHGYLHLRPDRLTPGQQREEIVRGIDAFESRLGVRPVGYRSPSWELTPETFALLVEHDFRYDSSCMADDRPYLMRVEGRQLIQLPVHWSLDDWPYYGWTGDRGGLLHPPSVVREVWLGEFATALRERRHVTYTAHPEISGRGYRLDALREMIEEMRGRAAVWFVRHDELAALVARAGVAVAEDLGARGGAA